MPFFRRKKKVAELVPEPEKKEPSLLERLCGDDRALCEQLSRVMYLDPRDKGTYEEAMKRAGKAEKEGNDLKARMNYRAAGALALYEENVEGVKIAFSKVGYKRISEVPEKAIEIAHKHYSDPNEGFKSMDEKKKK